MSDTFDHAQDALDDEFHQGFEEYGRRRNAASAPVTIHYVLICPRRSTTGAICIEQEDRWTWIPRSQIKRHNKKKKEITIPAWLEFKLDWKMNKNTFMSED